MLVQDGGGHGGKTFTFDLISKREKNVVLQPSLTRRRRARETKPCIRLCPTSLWCLPSDKTPRVRKTPSSAGLWNNKSRQYVFTSLEPDKL